MMQLVETVLKDTVKTHFMEINRLVYNIELPKGKKFRS